MSGDLRGTHAGRWELVELVGRGGMARVWRGRDEYGTDVAIKVFENRTSNFESEASAMAGLVHPRIIRILDFGQMAEHDLPYVAMEFARGPVLDDFIATHRLNWRLVHNVLRGVLEGLAHAHARGIIHRDLKPANIFSADAVGNDWQIGDFGIARRMAELNEHSPQSGTPAYMAPEQFDPKTRGLGPWTDLYAFGCMVYSLTTGEPPFGQGRGAVTLALHHVRDTPPRLEPRFDVPAGLADYASVLLRKDAFARFECAADALRALEKLRTFSGPTMRLEADVSDAVTPAYQSTLDLGDLAEFEWEAGAEGAPPRIEPVEVPLDAPDSSLAKYFRQLRSRSTPSLGRIRDLPLVGRHPERDVMWKTFASGARESKRREIWLTGEPGVGKSALARWLFRTAQEHGFAYGYAFRNEPLRYAVARFVKDRYAIAGLSAEQARSRIRLRADVPHWAVDQLLQVCRPNANLTSDTIDALMATFAAESRRRPLILWFDDVDRNSTARALIQRLRGLSESVGPITIVATSRAPVVADEVAEGLVLEVEPLQVSECVALVQELTGVEAAVARSIADRVNGNPRLAVDLVYAWNENGWIVRSGDWWTIREDVNPTLPADVDEFRRNQIARLTRRDSDQRALQILALWGGPVTEAHWRDACDNAALSPSDRLLTQASGTLLRLIDGKLAFADPQVGELLAEEARLSGATRELHRAIVEVVEEHASEYGAGTLGVQLRAAGEFERALPHLLAGAENGQTSDPIRSRELLDLYDEALDELGIRELDERRLRAKLVRLRLLDFERLGIAAFEVAIDVIDGARELGLTTLEAEAIIAYVRHAMSHDPSAEALQRGERAVELATSVRDDALLGRAYVEVAGLMGYLGRLDDSLATYMEAERLAREQKDLALLADAQYGLGWIHFLLGDLDPAPTYLERAAANFRAVGMERKASQVEGFSGDVYRARGDLDTAEKAYLKSMAYRERSGRMASEPFLNMAMVELARKNPVEAAQWARQAVDFEGRHGRRVIWATHFATELVLAAHTRDEDHWDDTWARLQQCLNESDPIAHFDLTFAMDCAARRAHQRLGGERIQAAIDLAGTMWLRLDRTEEAAALGTLSR